MDAVVDLIRWLRLRIFTLRIVLLYGLLVVALWVCSSPLDIGSFLISCILSGVLLIVFRLWDDLADRQHDLNIDSGKEHVFVITKQVRFFVAVLCASLLVYGIALRYWYDVYSASIYVMLCIYMSIIYLMPVLRRHARIQREMLVLFKYPMFLLILTQASSMKTISVGIVLYSTLLLHFVIEHRQLHSTPKAAR